MDHDDLDEDIERLKIILQDEEGEEEGDSDGELRVLENNEEEYYSNASRPSTSSDVTASSFPTTSVCTDADEALFRFDPNTITAETCLAMNRAYQEVLLDTLRQIEISLVENRTRQRELEENVDEKVKKTDRQTDKETYFLEGKHMPYFKDKDGQIPPYNEDVRLKEKMNEEKQHVRPKASWTKRQRKMLIDAIKLNALEQVVRPLLNKQEVEMEKLQRCKNAEEIQETKARIEKVQQEIKQKQEIPADELLKNCDSKKIDFLKISVVTFGNKFSVTECESMWNTVLRPGINRDKWTSAEEEDLNRLAAKYEMRNWSKIAEELKSNRTPFQCLQHYQQNHIVYDNSEWTEEEDELLKEVVETCTYGVGRVKWFQVAYYIDRRSAEQCQSRWNKINPNRNIGRWSKEEDLQLVNAIHLHSGITDWNKIQELVPTRSAQQCRERFIHRISGNVLFKAWTYEDDKKLLQLHQEYGSNWVSIAKEFEGRTDNMVLVRYKRLMKWQRLSEDFFSQSRKQQKQLKHPAFKFGHGTIVPRSGLRLRLGRRGPPKKGDTRYRRKKQKSEIEKLKEIGGVNDSDDDDDDNDNDDNDKVSDNEDIEEEEEAEEDEETRTDGELQDSLDAFSALYNIQPYDYFRQIDDKARGLLVVPRPPPVKKQRMNIGPAYWKRQDNLQNIVAAQIDLYIGKLQKKLENENGDGSVMDLDLYDQISSNFKVENEEEKRRLIHSAFGGKNPSNLSVRELLNISKCIKEHGRPPKNPKRYDLEPWEVEDSEDDKQQDESSSENELEEVSEEEKKEKPPRTEKQKAQIEVWKLDVKKHHQVRNQIKRLIQSKMDPKELSRGRGRKKQFLMYPKHILMKYRGLEEERRLNRKSLVLLMKTLDVDANKAFFKAKRGKRKLSAMAFLKAAERSNLKRAKTRRQKTEIQEAAKVEANMNSEISEVSEYLLELRNELKIDDDETDEHMSVDENEEDDHGNHSNHSYGYNKSLPYIPPNKTNLLGMRSLLLEHRYLIDQAGMYFNASDLKEKLYQLKQKGPNPLMGVLNAIGKTESVAKKREKDKRSKSDLTPMLCKKRLEEVRRTTDYQKLKARFQSIFSWPALLATVKPPKGKPLPSSLQNIAQEKLAVIKGEKSENVDTEPVDEAVVETENVEEDEADVEDLPEEEAVEKLVDKIMEEYEKERMKKNKRYLPTKKTRSFSEKRKQAFVEKERTKILKRLGLYEKMQEFKRRRQEAKEGSAMSNPTSTVTSTSVSQTKTESDTERVCTKSAAGVDSANDTTVNDREIPMSTSEGCQADFPDDTDMTDIAVRTDIIPKRKRGRPPGAKTKCYSDKSPERKSRRTTETPVVVKLEQDYEMSPQKKKTQSKKKGSQYNFVRTMIPDRLSKIASQIPELPILNEPIPEKPVKSEKKQKVEKPKTEKKRVYRSKFANERDAREGKEEGKVGKRGPKLGPMLKQLQEIEKAATDVQIKTEPPDSDEEDNAVNMNVDNVNATEQESVNNTNEKEDLNADTHAGETGTTRKKIITSRAKKSLQEGINKSVTVNKKYHNAVSSQSQGIKQSGIKNRSENKNDVESAINGVVDTPVVEKVQSQNDSQQVSNDTEGRKPLIVAIPVMIGGTQQVACIPFYPDDEGKITLPNGKKIDASGATDQAAVSLPLINFDQPLQVYNPGQQSAQSTVQQAGASIPNQSASVPNQGTSEHNTQTTVSEPAVENM